jgi:hypothetical protein
VYAPTSQSLKNFADSAEISQQKASNFWVVNPPPAPPPPLLIGKPVPAPKANSTVLLALLIEFIDKKNKYENMLYF